MKNAATVFRDAIGRSPAFVARAPGRIEFLGNHTDYNGGEVLGAAIDRSLEVAVAPRSDGRVVLISESGLPGFEFASCGEALRNAEGWVRYPLGVLSILLAEGRPETGGFDFVVRSESPAGAGLSSSAALELASSLAFEHLAGRDLGKIERVRACRRAENEYVGMPCGILDQGVSGFGEAGRLVHIDCADESFSTVPGLEDTVFWVFESGHEHSLVDSLYSERHRECREACEAIRRIRPDLQWLAHAGMEDLEAVRGEISDAVSARAEHVIREHGRVRECVSLLEKGCLPEVGRLLLDSHWSSSRLFDNSIAELDTLVDLLSAREGVYGARLTGGGFGGAVMALCDQRFDADEAEAVSESFRKKHGAAPVRLRLRAADGASGEDLI